MTITEERALEKKLPVIEIFGPTIQGEGVVIGQQTYFVRMGLCDYKCTMCDSLHAVLPEYVKKNASWQTQDEMADNILAAMTDNTTPWLTISGGNPCIHELGHFVDRMHAAGKLIHVETQGTLYPKWLGDVDMLTCSPKGPGMGEITDIRVLDNFLMNAYTDDVGPDALKIVVFDQRDLDFAREIFSRYVTMGRVTWSQCFLSLGNAAPPPPDANEALTLDHGQLIEQLLANYRLLSEDIMVDPILSKVVFLPQWHVFVFGNAQGH